MAKQPGFKKWFNQMMKKTIILPIAIAQAKKKKNKYEWDDRTNLATTAVGYGISWYCVATEPYSFKYILIEE